jgi:hypothetical protein
MARALHRRQAAVLVFMLGSLLGMLAWSSVASASNPADDPALLSLAIEEDQYDYAHRCTRKPTPGALRLQDWIERHYSGDPWGIVRCERLSKHTRSLHSEGRALDWHLDAKVGRDRRAANALIELLLATDALGNPNALARRMGVQEIIYNCRIWASGSASLERYDVCDQKRVDRTTAHRDHLHIGLNWPGAKLETSFWRSGLADL